MESGSPKPEEITKQEAYESLSADVENDEKKVSSEQSSSGTSKDKKQEISGPEKHYRSIAAMFKYVTHRKAIYASLLNDYVESDVFVIDGDSLLISCACDASLKKGQSLHFFFLVERFLLNLTDKGARYVIVFFEDMEQTYSQRSVLKCWRTQLKIHLLKNTKTTIITFPNFFSAQWKTFLKEQAPYFIMVSDRGVSLEQTYFLNMLMLHSLENKLDVVLTAGQESDNLRVYGFHIKSSLPTKMLITQLKKSSKEPLKTIQLQKHELIKSPLEALKTININEQAEKCISLFQTHPKDVRAVTCVLACSLALRVSAESKQDEHMSLEEASDLCKMHCLCVAIMVIVPLSQRTRIRKLTTQWNKKAVSFLNMYTLCEEIALTQMKDHIKDKLIDWTYVSDIKDDLLLKNIANYYEKENNKEFKLEFGNEINQLYTFLWETALKLIPKNEHWLSCELRKSSTPFLSEDSTVHVEKEEVDPVGLIPMQSDIIEDFAGDMIKELPIMCSDDPRIPLLMNTKTYDELSHWHTNRPLSDDYDRTKNNSNEKKYDRERGLRDYQKLQLFQYRYGQSLGVKTSKKIVLKNDQPEEKSSAYVAFKKKEPQKKKKDQIIEENLKKTRAEEEKKEMGKWKTMATSLEKDVMVDFFSGLQKLEIFIRSFQTPYVKYQAQLRALSICFDKWSEECKMKSKDKRDINIAVEIMKRIQEFLKNNQDILQKEDRQRIATYLSKLGFDNLAVSLRPEKLPNSKDELTESRCAVGVGSVRFQLQYMGPHLKRDERSDPDPRVQHFIPDTWQRELLDIVDKNESAVIVAPTSSGKTYASYYCMEKVLSLSDEAVVVYIAPTKALVNQVVATVISQFNKDLPNGIALCGVFTRDYRTDALNSQVLVTVPQCLEILLLCPHRQEWVKRIKYVIFDEVHCLGGEIGAETWDHILSMIRCPFLALSATISNPEHLTAWLQSVKRYWQLNDEREMRDEAELTQKRTKKKPGKTERRSYNVRLVQYDKRYNDLEKYICSVNDSDFTFEHYHPCASMTIDHIKNYGIPKDLTFSPRESLQLYDCMAAAWPDMPNLKDLDPEENIFLKDKIIITKNDTSDYEEALKKEFVDWVQKGYNKKVSDVMKSLKSKESSEVECTKYFPLLVEELEKMDKLPAIFFAFKLDLVEGLAKNLDKHLNEKWKMKRTEEDEKNIKKVQAKAEKLEKGLQAAQSESILRASSKVDELMTRKANYDSLMKQIEKFNELPSDCTYADVRAVDKETLEQLYFNTRNSHHSRLIGLSRKGIGYHHGSVDAKGRRLVEMLFRMGYIRVVTATGSLALGINMPCKSVVFLDDSVYLDALNYRQMAGRAGRRGQDLVGNVYFFNIPMPKVQKLLKSNVPQLKGQFPLNVSYILRLMLLAAKADDKKDAKAKVLSILMHPLMSFNRPQETKMLKLYCIFSLQFLLYERFLNQDCEPTEFAGLVTHLHYHEPSNYVLVRFIEKGLFHQLCKPSLTDPNKFPDSVMETLVLILANLFGRHYLPPTISPGEETFFQSKVFLDNLPDDFIAAVKEHNWKVATVFGQCILAGSKLADLEKEYQLPLSNINFSGRKCVESGLVDHLMSCCRGRIGINPFACLSGNTDNDLMSMENLSSLMMQTANIPEMHIPLLAYKKTDLFGRKRYLNAYALDFFKHGSLDAIAKDNRFNSGAAFYSLRDFYLTIASLSVSLKELCDTDPVALAFEQLRLTYHEKLHAVWQTV